MATVGVKGINKHFTTITLVVEQTFSWLAVKCNTDSIRHHLCSNALPLMYATNIARFQPHAFCAPSFERVQIPHPQRPSLSTLRLP